MVVVTKPELFGALFHTLLFNTFFILHLGASHWNKKEGPAQTPGSKALPSAAWERSEPPYGLSAAPAPAARRAGGRVSGQGHPQENAAQPLARLPREQLRSHNHRELRTSARDPPAP